MHFDQIEFGARLKKLRKERGLTQEQLAAAVHISMDHLGKIEGGKRGISIDLLLALSEVLDVTLDFLVKGTPDSCAGIREVIEQMRVLLDQLELLEGNPD